MSTPPPVHVLDCTVRDGSYAIDFQWPLEKVRDIVAGLAASGFRYIEVGHGVGLGAERSQSAGLHADREYIEAAVAVKGASLVGAFFIPGIGHRDDLKAFRAAGGDFVRVGTNVSDTAQARAYIEYAKELGFEVCYNCMKSYVAKPFEFCRRMSEVARWGADAVYLVDSAGGMLPDEVGRYVHYLRQTVDVAIGFHGHNNLMLANAASLEAVRNGATMVDASLLGMGRGAGNAQTEIMLILLDKIGRGTGIDPIPVLKLAEKCIQPIDAPIKGIDREEVVLGYALFHSSYSAMINRVAAEYGVEADAVVIEVAKIDRQSPTEALAREVARQLRAKKSVEIFFPKFCHRKLKG